MLASVRLLYGYYDRFWYPPDEGNYAHVAQRILEGETLNLQVQDVHPGYINFVNAAALRLFGADLISLRYPLVLVGLIQAVALFLIFPAQTLAGCRRRESVENGPRRNPVPQSDGSLGTVSRS